MRDAWEAVGLAGTDSSVAVHCGEVERRLLDLADDRLALMDETGLDVQVLSLTTPALHDLRREGVDLARRANDAVAQPTTRWPDRFQSLAVLPVALPEEAALELERCVRTFGFKGAMLCGRDGDRTLDHPDLRPVFERAAMLGVPIPLHPRTPAPAIRSALISSGYPESRQLFDRCCVDFRTSFAGPHAAASPLGEGLEAMSRSPACTGWYPTASLS